MNEINRRQLIGKALAAASLPLASHVAQAAPAAFPSRPIKWLVPYLPATGPDLGARILAEAVGPILGQPIVIENRAGAGGNIGARVAASAAPDGYTLLYTGTPLAANMCLYKAPGYDALGDFHHVMRLTRSDVALVVNAESDIRTMDELLARLKAGKGQVDYASGGIGTPSHLGVELFLSATGTQAMHVPYKGASELVNAVMGRQVAFGMPIFAAAYGMLSTGKLRALAVAGSQRNPKAPNVPTLAELGIPGVELTSWGGVSVPAKTPAAVVGRISSGFTEALKNPDVVARLEEQGGWVDVQGPAAFVQSIREEMRITAAMMKKIGLEPV